MRTQKERGPLERHIQSGALGVIGLLSLWTINTTNNANMLLAVQTTKLETVEKNLQSLKQDLRVSTADRYPRAEALRNLEANRQIDERQDSQIQELLDRMRMVESRIDTHQATHQ